MSLRLVAAAALLFAAPAFAQSASPTASAPTGAAPTGTAAAKPTQDQNKKIICRTNTETGSRIMAHKVCLPQAEWQVRDEETRETMDRSQATLNTPH